MLRVQLQNEPIDPKASQQANWQRAEQLFRLYFNYTERIRQIVRPGVSKNRYDREVSRIMAKANIRYRLYKLKSFLGIKTRGLNGDDILVLNIILKKNEPKKYMFVIATPVTMRDPEELAETHKTMLRIDENNYVSIFFDPSNAWGSFVIGEHIRQRLRKDFIQKLEARFRRLSKERCYLKAAEMLIKSMNKELKTVGFIQQ